MRELRNRHDVVGRAIAGAHRIGHLKIQHAIDLQLRVVSGDTDLAGHIQRDFFEAVFVGHALDKRRDEVQPGAEGFVVFSQSLDDPRILLRHDPECLGDKNHRNDKSDDC